MVTHRWENFGFIALKSSTVRTSTPPCMPMYANDTDTDTGHPCFDQLTPVKQGIRLPVSRDPILQAQAYSSPRSAIFFKLTDDQVLVFDWIAGSTQVN